MVNAQHVADAVVPGVGLLDGAVDAALRVVLPPRQHEGLELAIRHRHHHEEDVDTSRVAANGHVAFGDDELVGVHLRAQGRQRTVEVHAERDAVGLDAVGERAVLSLQLLDLEDRTPLLVPHGDEVVNRATGQASLYEDAKQAPRVDGDEVALDVADWHDVEPLGVDGLVEPVEQHVVEKHRRLAGFCLDPLLRDAWLFRSQSQRPSMQLDRLEDLPPHRERAGGPVGPRCERPAVDGVEHEDLLVVAELIVRRKHLAELANPPVDRRPESRLEVRQVAPRSVRIDVPVTEVARRQGVQCREELVEPSDVENGLQGVARSDKELSDERLVEHVGEVDVAQACVICLPDTLPHNAVQSDASFDDLHRHGDDARVDRVDDLVDDIL